LKGVTGKKRHAGGNQHTFSLLKIRNSGMCLNPEMQLIIEPDAKSPSKSFDFDMILSYALMQFSKVRAYFKQLKSCITA